MFDPWTDRDGKSVHVLGHKVGLFTGIDGKLEWWAYPAGWKPRGTIEAKGPFRSRSAAKAALDPTNFQNWITPQIDFDRGAVEQQKVG